MSTLKDKHGFPYYWPGCLPSPVCDYDTTETKEVQIIVRGGLVQAVHNWPEGLPGAVYDLDIEGSPGGVRIPIEELIEDDGDTDHVLVNTRAFDWLIAKAMTR